MTTATREYRVANSTQSDFHRYRVQVIARWPESEYKRAALRAARNSLNGELAYEQATANTKEGALCKLE
jgi:hypothetical protein